MPEKIGRLKEHGQPQQCIDAGKKCLLPRRVLFPGLLCPPPRKEGKERTGRSRMQREKQPLKQIVESMLLHHAGIPGRIPRPGGGEQLKHSRDEYRRSQKQSGRRIDKEPPRAGCLPLCLSLPRKA